MSPRLTKPVVHGRDHAPGGSDPIPSITDGGGAMQIADEGTLLPAEPVLNFVGPSVQATWNPGAGRIDVGVGGPYLMFGTDNTGTWLHLTTNGTYPADGVATRIIGNNAPTAALQVQAPSGAGLAIDAYGHSRGLLARTDNGGTAVQVTQTFPGHGIAVSVANGTGLDINATAGTSILISFNGVRRFKIDGTGIYMASNPIIGAVP